MWDVIFGGGWIGWLVRILMILGGVVIGLILHRVVRVKNSILYFRERDGRLFELPIAKEDAISLETKTDPPLRFWKWGRSYQRILSGFRRGLSATNFLGKEGTAYSWILEGFQKIATKFKTVKKTIITTDKKGKPRNKTITKEVPVEWKEKNVQLPFPTLEEAVKHTWPQTFYDAVPEEMKDKLRENRLLLTVEIEAGTTPKGYEPITERQINKKGDEDMAALFASKVKKAMSTPLIQWLLAMGAGGFVTFILCLLFGWIKIAPVAG